MVGYIKVLPLWLGIRLRELSSSSDDVGSFLHPWFDDDPDYIKAKYKLTW